jgi:1,4-alpha-glucan branching enzyme
MRREKTMRFGLLRIETLATALVAACACGAPNSEVVDADGESSAVTGGKDAAAGSDAAARDTGATGSGFDASAEPVLGANPMSTGVQFRVWAPAATTAWVEGDFPEREVAMSPLTGGTFGVTIADAHAGTTYHFSLQTPKGRLTRVDPYCRELLANGMDCHVIDPGQYAWQTPSLKRPARNASVVYELHVPTFSVAPGATWGNLAQARTQLGNLAKLGVDVVELMPVQDFGGPANGWGYNPQLYFTPKPGMGTAADLRAFVDAAHGLGIAVWLDVVINHDDGQTPLVCYDGNCPSGSNGIFFFPPGPWANTPWGPRLNFADPQVATMLRASASAWLAEFRGDGFRWDSVSNIRGNDGNGVTPGGKDLLVAINGLTHAAGGMSIAEDLKGWAAITQPASAGGFGFDAQWDGFAYNVTNVLAAADDGARDLGVVQGALTGTYAGDPFARLIFLEDHDIVGNGGERIATKIDPADPGGYYARKRSILGALLMLTTPGVPMIFMGQEWASTQPFGTCCSPPVLAGPTAQGLQVEAFFRDMIALRRNVAGTTGGLLDPNVDILHRDDAGKVIAYRRHGPSGKDVVVVLNFKNVAYTGYRIGVPSAGSWQIRLDSDSTTYGSDFGGGQTGAVVTLPQGTDGQPYSLPVRLGPYGGVVLSQ